MFIKKINPVKLKSKLPVVRRSSYNSEKARGDLYENEAGQLHWYISQLKLEAQRQQQLAAQDHEYQKWMAINYPTIKQIARERSLSGDFTYQPKISIITPVYNTNPDYLRACIESVIDQSYVNWELCIVDDASNNSDTLTVLNEYELGADPRIHIFHSQKNGHISQASNIALDMATGEFIALLDHDDLLWPNALYEVVKLLQDKPHVDFIYSDEDKVEADGYMHYNPYFKPDWSPHLLECVNYITHFSVLRTKTARQVGGFDTNMVGTQDWDLFLRVSEVTNEIHHIPTVLYSWRAHNGSTAHSVESKSYVFSNQKIALENHFARTKPGYEINNIKGNYGFWYQKYNVKGNPLVSIIIPTKDKVEYLQRCINSILDRTDYRRYEIIIIDTGSNDYETKQYYKILKEQYSSKKLKIKRFLKQPFNYSDACNFGAQQASGEYFLMLNNDTEVLTASWIEDMLGYAQQPEIAAVGAKLLYPDGRIQHAGVTTGIGSWEPVAGHPGIQMSNDTPNSLQAIYTHTTRDVSAVTAACLMVSAEKFWQIKGFNPKYRVTFNDVDLNLKLRKAGYLNIYLPFVELLHDESISVGRVLQNRDMKELNKSAELMRKQWPGITDLDPYYNKNFFKLSSHFELDIYPKHNK